MRAASQLDPKLTQHSLVVQARQVLQCARRIVLLRSTGNIPIGIRLVVLPVIDTLEVRSLVIEKMDGKG